MGVFLDLHGIRVHASVQLTAAVFYIRSKFDYDSSENNFY